MFGRKISRMAKTFASDATIRIHHVIPTNFSNFLVDGYFSPIARLLFVDHPKLFSFRVFHPRMKEGDLLIHVLHLRSSNPTV